VYGHTSFENKIMFDLHRHY